MPNRLAVLAIIEDLFANWTAAGNWACTRGCATCCTQNVAITTLEGERILDFIRRKGREVWLAEKLGGRLSPHRPRYTLNTLARACLAGKELAEEDPTPPAICPFLEENCCTIYPVRPFGCRSFLSLHTCSPARPALAADAHLAACTALNQLIEHLDQRRPWGNMLDILTMLATAGPHDKVGATRSHTLRSQPLPGFLLDPREHQEVAPLLERIFTARMGGRSVEDLLNGGAGLAE